MGQWGEESRPIIFGALKKKQQELNKNSMNNNQIAFGQELSGQGAVRKASMPATLFYQQKPINPFFEKNISLKRPSENLYQKLSHDFQNTGSKNSGN